MYEIRRGATQKPIRCVVYGPEGVGKTTFAASWPGAVLIDVEDGSGHYDVARFPRPESWTILKDELMAAKATPEVGTLVIDTADAAEALCTAAVLKDKKWSNIEDPGFGKGYAYLASQYAKMLELLDDVVAAGKNVVLVAHAQIRKFEQPDELGAYDRWELKLQKKCAALVKEWCDLLLFANYETDVMTNKETKKVKARGGKRRVMYASHTASWDAKNRLGLADEMPFEFAEIADKVPTAEELAAERASEPEMTAKPLPSVITEEQEYLREIANGNLDAKPPAFVEVTPPAVRQLHEKMELSGVKESQLRSVVEAMSNNPYTYKTAIAEYSEKFVGNLVKNWKQVEAEVRKASSVYDDDIPF